MDIFAPFSSKSKKILRPFFFLRKDLTASCALTTSSLLHSDSSNKGSHQWNETESLSGKLIRIAYWKRTKRLLPSY